jgi:very-short-patch-repair endonuclease
MACGPGSTISDTAAAWLLGHREVAPYLPHVSNATGRGRTLDGVKVHQREIEPRDLFRRFDIPCTASARTILDCAARVGVEQLEELLMAADSGRPRLDRNRMEQLVAANPGARGIANLRELITDDPKESRSENERRMLRICRRFEIRDPETEYEIRAGGKTFYADFCWPELGLIVECDSWRWHGGKLKVERDRNRDQLLTIAGWIVVHFTRNQIKLEPDTTGRKLLALTSPRAPRRVQPDQLSR